MGFAQCTSSRNAGFSNSSSSIYMHFLQIFKQSDGRIKLSKNKWNLPDKARTSLCSLVELHPPIIWSHNELATMLCCSSIKAFYINKRSKSGLTLENLSDVSAVVILATYICFLPLLQGCGTNSQRKLFVLMCNYLN